MSPCAISLGDSICNSLDDRNNVGYQGAMMIDLASSFPCHGSDPGLDPGPVDGLDPSPVPRGPVAWNLGYIKGSFPPVEIQLFSDPTSSHLVARAKSCRTSGPNLLAQDK